MSEFDFDSYYMTTHKRLESYLKILSDDNAHYIHRLLTDLQDQFENYAIECGIKTGSGVVPIRLIATEMAMRATKNDFHKKSKYSPNFASVPDQGKDQSSFDNFGASIARKLSTDWRRFISVVGSDEFLKLEEWLRDAINELRPTFIQIFNLSERVTHKNTILVR